MSRPAGYSSSESDSELELVSSVLPSKNVNHTADFPGTTTYSSAIPHNASFSNGASNLNGCQAEENWDEEILTNASSHDNFNEDFGSLKATSCADAKKEELLQGVRNSTIYVPVVEKQLKEDYNVSTLQYKMASPPPPALRDAGLYKYRSPTPRQQKMHEGLSFPLEELRLAARDGNLAVVKALISQGIPVDQFLKSGWTPLMYACSSGKASVAEYLLQQGADPNLHKELFTPLMATCASSQESEACLFECLKLLLDFGAKVNIAERHRMTALMFACKEGRCTLVEKLIEAKADLNLQDNRGWSALCWAATKGKGKVVRTLLQNGADIHKVTAFGQRASDVALSAGYAEISDILERIAVGDGPSEASSLVCSIPSKEKARASEQRSLTYGELEMVLCGLELGHLIDVFHAHKVTFEMFLQLTEADLVAMGVTAIGVQKKIFRAIKDIHCKEWKTSSLPNLSHIANLSVLEAAALLANLKKHVRYMHASIGYLRDRVEASPRILQLGQERHSVESLSRDCRELEGHVRGLGEELRYFGRHLDKISGNAEFAPADLITEQKDDGALWHRRMAASLLAVTLVGAALWYGRPKTFFRLFNLGHAPSNVVLDL